MSPSEVTALRQTLGVNPLQLAELLGVPTRLVLQWEAGDRFPTKRHCEFMRLLLKNNPAADRLDGQNLADPAREGTSARRVIARAESLPSIDVAGVVQRLLEDAEFTRRLHALVSDYLSSSVSSLTRPASTSSPSSK